MAFKIVVLLFGLFLFPLPCFSAPTNCSGNCVLVHITNRFYQTAGTYRSVPTSLSFDDCGVRTLGPEQNTGSERWDEISYKVYKFDTNVSCPYTPCWRVTSSVSNLRIKKDIPVPGASTFGGSSWTPDIQYPDGGCFEPQCDQDDEDNDGVCNECDKVPNAPDPEDCILVESIDKNTSQVVGVSIDIGCTNDGTNVQHWTSENYNATTARSYANIGNDKDKIGRENCQTGLPEGQCCAYAPGSKGELYTVGLNPVVMGPPSHEAIIDSLTDLPSPLDLPEKCAGHNDMCSQYCEDKLGVALSSCREDKDGAKISNCECNNTFQVRTKVAPDSEELDKVAAANQALKADSNSNGVPDYADAETQSKTDSDNDGIHDQADVDSTGGTDSDGDGIDDQYTVNAHATAVAHAGLATKDSQNLDAIERSTAQTASGVGAVKGAVDGLTTEVQGLRSDLATENPEIKAHRDKVTGMIDSFTEDNTATIDESQLNSDLFTGLQSSDVPEDPTEDFDVEAFVQEFSFAFPDQLDTLIKGSAVNVSNSDSCIEGIVMGAPFEFCFDKFQSIFMIMGLIFKGLCTFRAMEIIIAGVRL
ncbi:MAG: hypothetical protein QXX12_03345 [Nanopusillaceae archaeon]